MTNELEVIKDCQDSLPGPAPEVTARAWVLLAEEIEAERTGSGHRQPAPSRRLPLRGFPGGRWAMRAGVAVGLAAAVTAGLVLVRGGDDSAPLGTPPASAAELLRHAASVAAREDVRPGPGQFVYVDQKTVTFASGPEGDYTQDVRREMWMPAGEPGKTLTRSTYGQTHAISGRSPEYVQSPEQWSTSARGSATRTPWACLPRPPIFPPILIRCWRRSAGTRRRSSGRTSAGEERRTWARTRST
ncbi:hypothetical protein ACFQYP_35185 [Nonomuraea antimicrobica]